MRLGRVLKEKRGTGAGLRDSRGQRLADSSLRRVVMRLLGIILLVFGFAILGLLARHMIDPPCGFCDDIGSDIQEDTRWRWSDVLIIAAGAAAAAGGAALLMRSRREYKPLSILGSDKDLF
jgi:hypothetical protein